MFKFLQERFNKLSGTPFPLKYIYLNTTGGTCTNKCYMCPGRSFQQDLKKMPDEIFKKTIQELRLLDYDQELHFYAQNEPFMDKNIFDKLDYAAKILPKAQLAIISNFTLLTDEMIDKILSSPLSMLSNSIYGLKPDVFQKITGRNNFERTVINQIKFLKRFGQNPKFSFALYLMNNENNQEDIEFCKFFIFNIAPTSIATFYPTGAYFNTVHQEKKYYKYFISTCINNALAVHSNGDVTICSLDCEGKMAVGSLYHNSLQELYNSKAAQKIRRHMLSLSDKNAYCKICDFGKTEHFLLYFLPLPAKIKNYLTQKLLKFYHLDSYIKTVKFSCEEIKEKAKYFNEIFKDGDEENWINCLNELRRKFYAKEL